MIHHDPVLLIIAELFIGGSVELRGSLSAYYHTSARDVFVGGLCMVGILLALIVQDPTLLHQAPVFAGLRPSGYLLINSARGLGELGLAEFASGFRQERVLVVPASELARELVGRPVPNAALLGGFAALTGVVSLSSVELAIRQRFAGSVAEGNVAAAARAFEFVRAEREELEHA